jgi:hypothetical protein
MVPFALRSRTKCGVSKGEASEVSSPASELNSTVGTRTSFETLASLALRGERTRERYS